MKTLDTFAKKHAETPKGAADLLAARHELENLAAKRAERRIEIGPKAPPFRFGLISCTHFGSVYEEIGITRACYDWFEQEGIKRVYHCGDATEGDEMRKGHVHEVHKHGADAQVEWFCEQYPHKKGIQTFLISGNHDMSHMKNGGANVCKAIGNRREDVTYMGDDYARFIIDRPGEREVKLDLVHPDGGVSYALCMTGDHEVLSQNGWVRIDQLQKGVAVATRNRATEQFEWQVPTDYVQMPFKGDLLYFKSHHYNAMVTPDHRFWARRPWQRCPKSGVNGKKKNVGYQMVYAKNIRGRDWVIPKACKWDGKECEIPEWKPENKLAFIEMLGWYIAEGSCSNANKQVSIAQWNDANRDRLVLLAKLNGFNPYVAPDKRGITISKVVFYNWIKKYCPGHSHTKRIPAFLKDATKEELQAFLDGYLGGDGCRQARGWHSCTTVSRLLADDLQELILKLGFSSCLAIKPGVTGHSIKGGPPIKTAQTSYMLSFNYKFLEPQLRKAVKVPFDGEVYCVSVPNEVFMIRRDGKTCWTGNSYKPQKMIESLDAGTKPDILCVGHFHKAFTLPAYRGVCSILAGCTQRQTGFMRRNGLAAHVGCHIVEVRNLDGSVIVSSCWRGFYPATK